jgi:subtilisin family serine protease
MKKTKISILVFCLLIMVTQLAAALPDLYKQESDLAMAIQKSLQDTRYSLGLTSVDNQALNVAEAREIEIAELDYLIYWVKILDIRTGTIYPYWYDENLELITEESAFRTRTLAYQAKYGHLSRSLYNRVNSSELTEQSTIPVAIWAEVSLGVISNSSGGYKVYLPIIIAGGGSSPTEKIFEFLNQRGYAVDYLSSEAPVVYASIPSSVINELQSQSYVSAIYEQVEGHLDMDSAARTSAAPWTWSRGITGKSIKVAVLENDGVAFDNPYIDGSKYHIDWWRRIGDHATEVAGVIASTHSDYKGIAYDAEILSANALTFWDPNVVAATDWAIASGADVINASFGTICGDTNITSMDKYFDWVVWDKRKTVVVSAGNLRSECSTNYNVSSPGKAYNVITVGSKDDMNTATTEDDTKDDRFSYFSLYVDPVTAAENRLKPEIVAVGQRIKTTSTSSPWIGSAEVAGTSFSAPIVAGQAALMMERSSWLKYSPEAVKAGIMATARWTQLHDDVNWDQWASIDKMGVGAIDITAADNSLINNRIQELYLRKNNFTDNHYDINFDGLAGQRIRVVITWSSHPTRVAIVNWILHDRLESDFDLTVTGPNGEVFGSYANEANYEIVEFTAPSSGSYRVRIHLSRWDDSSMEEKIGFSWYSGSQLP